MSLSTSINTRLHHQHETIRELIKGLSEEQLIQKVIPGKWSVLEQIAHLAAYQPVFLERIRKMEKEQGLSFERYVADNDPAFHESCKKTLKELLDDINTQRFLVINHLTSLSEQSLRCTGRHLKFGWLTITEWTEFFLLHEAHHLFSIFMLTSEWRQLKQNS